MGVWSISNRFRSVWLVALSELTAGIASSKAFKTPIR